MPHDDKKNSRSFSASEEMRKLDARITRALRIFDVFEMIEKHDPGYHKCFPTLEEFETQEYDRIADEYNLPKGSALKWRKCFMEKAVQCREAEKKEAIEAKTQQEVETIRWYEVNRPENMLEYEIEKLCQEGEKTDNPLESAIRKGYKRNWPDSNLPGFLQGKEFVPMVKGDWSGD